jgi:hypothetical protein
MDTEVKTEAKACEFKATIGKDGQLVIETDSEECQKIAIEAASEKGVDVKHVKPKAVTGDKPKSV